YASIKYEETDPVRGKKGTNHAVFIGEKWKSAEGIEYYSVADSNGNPGDLAHYTWEQLRSRLNSLTLLKPEDPAVFRQKVLEFVKGKSMTSSVAGEELAGNLKDVDWGRVAENPSFAK